LNKSADSIISQENKIKSERLSAFLFSRRSAAVAVREIQNKYIFTVYGFLPPPPPINFVPVCAQLFI